MAEVATKKSINVVSSKKSEVCNVQSNNGLIDLDDLTASNNQLISLCDDDDLVLTKNTCNTLDSDDKSLQELIDSELALRIRSNKSDDKIITDTEESEEIVTRPETIKKIILDHRQNLVDINAKFITVENEHCSLINEFCISQNDYVSPNINEEVIKSELILSRDEEKKQFMKHSELDGAPIITQKINIENNQISNYHESINSNDSNNSKDANVECQIAIKESVLPINDISNNICDFVDNRLIMQQVSSLASSLVIYPEQDTLMQNILNDTNQTNINQKDKKNIIWTEQTPLPDNLQADQIFDNFDEAFYQQSGSINKQEYIKKPINVHANDSDEFCRYNRIEKKEDKISKSTFQDEISHLETKEKHFKLKEKLKDSHDIHSIQEQSKCFNDDVFSHSESFMKTGVQEFFDVEHSTLKKEASQEISRVVLSEIIDSTPLKSIFKDELTECSKHIEKDTQNLAKSSNEFSNPNLNFLKNIEFVSDTDMLCSNTKQIVEQLQNMDSWTTVEEATKATTHLTDIDKKQKSIRKHNTNIDEAKKNYEKKQDDFFALPYPRAPLATPDEMEISEVSNTCNVSVFFSRINFNIRS
jgi:hypothetical protein